MATRKEFVKQVGLTVLLSTVIGKTVYGMAQPEPVETQIRNIILDECKQVIGQRNTRDLRYELSTRVFKRVDSVIIDRSRPYSSGANMKYAVDDNSNIRVQVAFLEWIESSSIVDGTTVTKRIGAWTDRIWMDLVVEDYIITKIL